MNTYPQNVAIMFNLSLVYANLDRYFSQNSPFKILDCFPIRKPMFYHWNIKKLNPHWTHWTSHCYQKLHSYSEIMSKKMSTVMSQKLICNKKVNVTKPEIPQKLKSDLEKSFFFVNSEILGILIWRKKVCKLQLIWNGDKTA